MEIFVTHIGNKILFPDIKLTAIVIYAGLTFITLLSAAKAKKTLELLDFTQTQQLRGIAVLLVVIGHLGVHVIVKNKYIPFLGPHGISLFLFLSGYGLIRSHEAKKRSLLQFVQRRTKRVFVPYWITTVLFLLLNYFLLSEQYSLKLILLTTFGLNFDRTTQLLDYVRWFIPLILFLYSVFFIATRTERVKTQVIIITLVPMLACFFNYFFSLLPEDGYNPWNCYILLFPLGCVVGLYAERIKRILPSMDKFQWSGLIFGILFFVLYICTRYFYLRSYHSHIIVFSAITNCYYILFSLFALSTLVFFSSHNLYYRFLYLMGSISYEVYLLHCAFMVKYDFILFRFPVKYSFFIYLAAICLLAYGLKKLSASVVKYYQF